MKSAVPQIRIRAANGQKIRAEGDFVLYWMTAFRRVGWNFSFQRAIEHAVELSKPLVVFEPLRTGYRWANDRIHRFVIDGMIDNAKALADTPVAYYPFLERTNDEGKGLFEALAKRACIVVADDYPCFFLPAMLKAAAKQSAVLVEAIDGNGLLPMRAADQTFTVAHSFRRWLQKNLRPHLDAYPQPNPVSKISLPKATVPKEILKRWPAANLEELTRTRLDLAKFAIDHSVKASETVGGSHAGKNQINQWVRSGYDRYANDRSHPDDDASSGLSPYLHFGHVAAHEVLAALAKADGWKRTDITGVVNGKREGWWGASPAFEAYMEELLVWREIGFNMCHRESNYDQFDSLPSWAKATLTEHANDPRSYVYDLPTFEMSQTHDPVWNAAQRELRDTGRLHNYLRMLWGKKILEWSATPQDALATMIELNNKYALDGRDPNSYSGIFWVLGRYDRPWAPVRPIYGSIRYMTSESTVKKLRMKRYLARFGEDNSRPLWRE
jgi:deoxyribodipyrimidine photo-lyase